MYRTPPEASLGSAFLPLPWEPSQKELCSVWETLSPKASVRNTRKIHSTRFKIKQLCCNGDLAQSHMTGSRPLSPVFYFSLTHLNAPQKKSPGPCPIRKPALFFLYTALHYPHTTRWRDASERSIYSGRGWGAMNLYSSVFKLKEKLRSCCVHQLSHALYWRVNKTLAFNLHWKEWHAGTTTGNMLKQQCCLTNVHLQTSPHTLTCIEHSWPSSIAIPNFAEHRLLLMPWNPCLLLAAFTARACRSVFSRQLC